MNENESPTLTRAIEAYKAGLLVGKIERLERELLASQIACRHWRGEAEYGRGAYKAAALRATRYKAVIWRRGTGESQKLIHIGRFETEEAANAANHKAIEQDMDERDARSETDHRSG